MDDIQFVDADRAIGGGTGERPFATIQEGVDNASGDRNVYVFDASQPYNENVVLTDDITLWGSGSLIPAYGGRTFGSGIAPVVDGMSMGPALTMANRTTVRGFTVRNTDTGGAPIMEVLPSAGIRDISRIGILGNDVTELTITENSLSGNTVGALLARQGDFNLLFSGNLVQDNDHTGLEINATGNSGTFNARVENSLFQNNGGDGANIIANTYDTSIIQVRNSQFNNNSDGFSSGQFDTELAIAVVSGSTGNDNNGMGLGVGQYSNVVSLANLSGSTANNNGGSGIRMMQDSLDASVGIIGLPEGLDPSIGALTAGFGLALPSEVATLLSATGPVTAENNAGYGVASFNVAQNDLSLGAFFDITASGNAGDGLMAQVINDNGIAASVGGSSANWSEILQLADTVIGPAFGIDLPLFITGNGHMQVNNNSSGIGMNLTTIGETASISAFAGLDATGNAGPGVVMVNASQGISISALARANLSGNTADGLIQQIAGTDAAISVLADVTASNNGGRGIFVSQSADQDAYLFMLGVEANDNAGLGVVGLQNANNGNALAILADLEAMVNGAGGIQLNQTAAQDAISAVVMADIFGNNGVGLQLNQTAISGGAFSLLGGVDSIGNNALGILMNLSGGDDAVAAVTAVNSSQNLGGDGMLLSITADDEAVLLAGDGAFTLFDTNYVGGMGADLLDMAGALVPQDEVAFNENAGVGLNAVLTSANGDVWVSMDGAEANQNTGGHGILLDLEAANGSIYSGILNAEASDNSNAGLLMNFTGTGAEAVLAFEDVTTSDNGNAGLNIVEEYTGTVNILGQSLVSTDNGGAGVRVSTDGAGAVVDFGGGALGSLGQSSIYGNGNVDMRKVGPGGAIVAQHNWWGIAPPAAGQFGGTVDYSNWLIAPPTP